MSSYYEKILATGEVKCIDEEVPFDIPQGWEWCRLKHICSMQAGKNISASRIFSDKTELHPYRCVGGNGLRGYTGEFNTQGHYSIVGRQGALCGCVNIEEGKFYATEHAVVVDTYEILSPLFMYYFLMALNLNKYATATAQPGLAVSNVLEVMCPLPPLNEGERIIKKLALLIPLVENYNAIQEKQNALNSSIKERLKKSILQEAIQGKLVPQIAEEGTAQELLEQIKAEKQNLVKEGKLKKSTLATSVIFRGDDNKYWEKNGKDVVCIDAEIPFEVPSSWIWCRMGDCVSIIGGYAFKSYDLKSSLGIRVIRISDISEKGLVNKNIVKYNGNEDLTQYLIKRNDILIAMTGGTVGKSLLLTEKLSEPLLLNQRVAIIRNIWINVEYLNAFLHSPYIKQIIDKKKNSTNDNISMSDLNGFLIPLPPLKEQYRIVERYKNVTSIMSK